MDLIDVEVVRLAQRLVCVHAEQHWPHGDFCVNCRAAFPCPLRRWGAEVLTMAGWSPPAVARLVDEFRREGRPVWLTDSAGAVSK